MSKGFKKKIEKAISRSAKLLHPKRKRRTVVAKNGELAASRRLAKLRTFEEKLLPRRKIKKSSNKNRQKALKLWEQSFGGGFCCSMKKTADFIKEERQKSKARKEKRRLRA
jgi:hypothetical protein